jgi:NADPH-dependent glutamate synthase beta subunit-like oxidoreductase
MGAIETRISAALASLMLASLGAIFLLGGSGQVRKKGETAKNVQSDDLLEQQSKELAGTGAIDCRRVAIAGDPNVASDCALAGQRAGKPFRVRYDIQGFDSFVAAAIVRTPIGTVGALAVAELSASDVWPDLTRISA